MVQGRRQLDAEIAVLHVSTLWLTWLLASVPAHAWDSRQLAVPIVIDEYEVPYPEFAIYATPGAGLRISLADKAVLPEYRFGGAAGTLGKVSLNKSPRSSTGGPLEAPFP